jgi:LmbE family N-acetylglucosaminyl deacetylase
VTGGLLVVSPHLDDAVLSAGQLLAAHPGAVVVTVFAGVPDAGLTGDFDTGIGFGDGASAMRARRDEDAAALALLGAVPVHLDHLDRQYRKRRDPGLDDAIRADLAKLIAAHRPAAVLGPVGLVHADHLRVGRIWPTIPAGDTDRIAYEELPYRVRYPVRAVDSARAFVAAHAAVESPRPGGDVGRKAQAILCYRSQLTAINPLECLVPERFWTAGAARQGPGRPL